MSKDGTKNGITGKGSFMRRLELLEQAIRPNSRLVVCTIPHDLPAEAEAAFLQNIHARQADLVVLVKSYNMDPFADSELPRVISDTAMNNSI